VSKVWAHCETGIQKCDVHFALGGYPLTCSGLGCTFDDMGERALHRGFLLAMMANHAEMIERCHVQRGDSPPKHQGARMAWFLPAGVFCSYTKCQCDGACPNVNGVSMGYMLDRLR
jgi:hypothetical protein